MSEQQGPPIRLQSHGLRLDRDGDKGNARIEGARVSSGLDSRQLRWSQGLTILI